MSQVYSFGRVLDLQTSTKARETIHARIEHVSLPFTKSQTMRIRLLGGRTFDTAVLKLYDRRFIDDRDDRGRPSR